MTNADGYGLKLRAIADDVLAEFLSTATHATNPRSWTNREILFVLNEAALKGAQLTLDNIKESTK